jgi:SAM-dependent methyltransferase
MSEYSTVTVDSPHVIKRYSHNARFSNYCKCIEKFCDRERKDFLDYGSGDGYIFNKLSERGIKNINLYAFEPLDCNYEQLLANVKENDLNVTCLKNLKNNKKFDYILCAEVLEHFSARNVIGHLDTFERILSDNGKVLVSVPVEIGFGGICKNIARWSIGGLHRGSGVIPMLKAFLNIPVYRGTDVYISSHTGFSYKQLEYLIVDSGWIIEKKFFSPIPLLGSVFNSQVFFELKRRNYV